MEPSRTRQNRLPLATLALLATLLAVPQTRWLFLTQLRCIVAGASLQANRDYSALSFMAAGQFCRLYDDADATLRTETLEEHPRNLGMHMAVAFNTRITPEGAPEEYYRDGTQEMDRIDYLRSKGAPFKDAPAYYATILRIACYTFLLGHRPETGCVGSSFHRDTAPPRRLLAQAAYAAAQGERIDRNNSFFPLMSSVILFAENRDRDALAALHRAAAKPHWNDYQAVKADGEIRLLQSMAGDTSPYTHAMIVGTDELPHISEILGAVSIAVYHAIQRERAGQAADAASIRQDLLCIGETTRGDASHFILSLVGMRISRAAVARPAGTPLRDESMYHSDEYETRKRFAPYLDYLQAHGLHQQRGYAIRVRDTLVGMKPFLTVACSFDRMPPLNHWFTGVGVGAALLSNTGWMLLLGAIAAIWGRSRRIIEGRPLDIGTNRGIAMVLLLALGSGSAYVSVGIREPWYPLWWLFAGSLVTIACAAGAWKYHPPAGKRIVGTATGIGVLILIPAVAFAAGRQCWFMFAHPLSSTSSASMPIYFWPDWILPLPIVVPLIVTAGFAVASCLLRVPVTVGLVRGFRALAVPIACSLFLAYVATVAVTMALDWQVERSLQRITEHEGRFHAERLGLPWPEAVRPERAR